LDPQSREGYRNWIEQGFHGEMGYMKRYEREDIRSVLPSARSVISLGMVYHTPHPLSVERTDPTRGWIARYAWGDDYHDIMKEQMESLLGELRAEAGEPFDARIYVDTGPILERAAAKAAGLGWIAKNTCLINEDVGSWFFLGEILTSLELAPDFPAADRCGTCTRCLEACPTGAITEPYVLDATRCISYYTIEVKGAIPGPFRPQIGRHVFGCDICQDVCPWNRPAPVTPLPQFQPRSLINDNEQQITALDPPLIALAAMTEAEFQTLFRGSPVRRARYRGFLRNVCVAMGNSGNKEFCPILERLCENADPLVKEHAAWALSELSAVRQNP
jgi:epoxyqueuosine reductase